MGKWTLERASLRKPAASFIARLLRSEVLTMKSRVIMAFAAVLALGSAGFSQTSTAVAYTYAALAFPGSTSSTAIAINNHNAVVGTFTRGYWNP